MERCIFCDIIGGSAQASFVLENELVVAILDISPINPGHTLVLPRRHVEQFSDLLPEEAGAMAHGGQRVAKALKGAMRCGGVTFTLAEGAIAGQEVMHAHLHVIPRHAQDGFGWRRLGNRESRGQLDERAALIRTLIG